MGDLLQHPATPPRSWRCHACEPLCCWSGHSRRAGPPARAQRRALGLPQGGAQRHRVRRFPACERGQALRRQHLRRAGQRGDLPVLGRHRATQDGCPRHARSGDPQEARRAEVATVNNSELETSQAYRSRFVSDVPEVDTSTIMRGSRQRRKGHHRHPGFITLTDAGRADYPKSGGVRVQPNCCSNPTWSSSNARLAILPSAILKT